MSTLVWNPLDNLVDWVKSMSISGRLDASRLSNEDDNKLANPVGVTLMSDRSVQLDRNRSWSAGNIVEEIKDVRLLLSSAICLGWQIKDCHRGSIWFRWVGQKKDQAYSKLDCILVPTLNRKMISKSSAVEGILYYFKNLESETRCSRLMPFSISCLKCIKNKTRCCKLMQMKKMKSGLMM